MKHLKPILSEIAKTMRRPLSHPTFQGSDVEARTLSKASILKGHLTKLLRNRGISTYEQAYQNVIDLLARCNFSALDLPYKKSNYNFNIEELAGYFIYVLQGLENNLGRIKPWEREEFERDRDCTTYFPIDSSENSTCSIYTVGNILRIMEHYGIIRKVAESRKFDNKMFSRCARYTYFQSKADLYLYGGKRITIDCPQKVLNRLISKVENYTVNETIVVCSCLLLRPSEKHIQQANLRRNAQRTLLKKYRGGELPDNFKWEEYQKELDQQHGIDIQQACNVVRLADYDLNTLVKLHYDTYGGRMYHAWSSIKKELREAARFHKDLLKSAEISRSNIDRWFETAEVDVTQCNFYILYNCFRRAHSSAFEPSELLTESVRKGLLRERVSTFISGECYDHICGVNVALNFDSIKTLGDAARLKDQIKPFMLKASNCKFGTWAGVMLDKGLSLIDRTFGEWMTNLRNGFQNLMHTKSKAPYITQQNEVDFMLGRKIIHAMPQEGETLRDTESWILSEKFPEKQLPGVLDYAVRGGVRVMVPIHDAIICLDSDTAIVTDALRQAAEVRKFKFSPAYKICRFSTLHPNNNKKIKVEGQYL